MTYRPTATVLKSLVRAEQRYFLMAYSDLQLINTRRGRNQQRNWMFYLVDTAEGQTGKEWDTTLKERSAKSLHRVLRASVDWLGETQIFKGRAGS